MLIGLVLAVHLLQTPTSYPVFETDKLSPALYKQRREAIKQTIGPDGVAVLFTNPVRNRNNDDDFRFRGDSNFLYLTGFEEPDAALILAPGGIDVDGKRVTELLFCNESNPSSITWLGYRMGSKEAPQLTGIEAAVTNTKFSAILQGLHPKKLWETGIPQGASEELQRMVASLQTWTTQSSLVPNGLESVLAKLRVVKSPEEIALMRHATEVSALAHIEAMRACKPGLREFQLQALLEYVFAANGCEAPAYNSIVGSGPNSCILHYEDDRRLMASGDMVCIDAAGEYHGYAADVTRSYPVNGHFTAPQRDIYEVVRQAQAAGIAVCRAGLPFRGAHEAARKVLLAGLKRLGIITKDTELATYFPHGTSHYVGLDVHDANGSSTLQAGAVLTVEPGLYIREGSPCPSKYWNIGVRIEDDILVTTGDPVVLSAAAPRTIPEIEKLMKDKRLGALSPKPLDGKD
jgi:Xaa-Pro aminopeptidase